MTVSGTSSSYEIRIFSFDKHILRGGARNLILLRV